MFTKVKTTAEIDAMRTAGKMLATVLDHLRGQVSAGMSTQDLADLAAKELSRLGGKPSFLGYQGFPDVLCVSVNDEVVHGIPNRHKILNTGDIVGLDFGVTHNNMVTDGAISVIVGRPLEARHQELLEATERALSAGIGVVKNGIHTGDIGQAVQQILDKHQLGIVRDLVGHGVGHDLHEEPNIPNYGLAGGGPILKTGMTIAIEPMATLGKDEVYIDKDGWGVRTRDGSRSAHFEHTILITENSAEILTTL